MSDTDPTAEARNWITDYLLSDEQRASEEAWETGTGEESWDLDLDRAARTMRALLALIPPPLAEDQPKEYP